MKVPRIKVNEEGLNRFFGPLEARIMRIIWESGELSIKEVQRILNEESPISFNAVMTVMNRLAEKGHLAKRARGRSTYFRAVQTKEQFLAEQTRAVTLGLIEEFGDLVVNHMIEALEQADPASIRKLEQKLMELKNRNKP